MKTPSYVEIQRHHVEESKKWPDLRAYAAEVLRRHEAKRDLKSKRSSASQHVTSPRRTDGPVYETRRSTGSGSDLVEGGKSKSKTKQLSNNAAFQRPGRFVVRENGVCHAIPDKGMSQSMRASSHIPSAAIFTAAKERTPWNKRENDGQGMDDASFQKLLAAIESGYPVPPKMNAASATPVPINVLLPNDASGRRKGITNPDSAFPGSKINDWNKPESRAPFINAIRPGQGVTFKLVSVGSNMNAENGRSNNLRKGRNAAARIDDETPIQYSNSISGGVSKKRKPKRNVRIREKTDERQHNLKVQGSRRNRQMPFVCPKTDVGCLLCFASRSPDCPHFKSVSRDAVPISRNEASAAAVSGQNASPFLGFKIGTSFNQNLGSRLPGVSKNGSIHKSSARKKGRGRKDSSAVAARQSTAQELAQLSAAAVNKSSSKATAMHAPEKSVGARGGFIPQLDSVQRTSCNAPEVDVDIVDTSSVFIPEDRRSIPTGLRNAEDDLSEGMFVNFPDHLSLPMLSDLPPPEEFFRGT